MPANPQSKGRILVTPRSLTESGHPELARLADAGYDVVLSPAGRQPTRDELLALLPGCVAYLAGVEPVGADILRAAPGLRVISRNGSGTDNVDRAAAAALGIRITRAEAANARSVAELTWGLLLGLVRHIPRSAAAVRAGVWTRQSGIELAGRTLGILGCGAIGRLVAGYATAFGMSVLAHDLHPDPALAAAPSFRFAPLPTVIGKSDVLSLHCPPSEKPLLGAGEFAQMRHGILLVNTARAELVDDAALIAALDSGKVAGYATDTFRREPPGDDPLARHENVIATPHVGALTRESTDRVVAATVTRLLDALDAKPPATS